MCELFALNSARPQTLNAHLTTFFGDSCMHPHGWGLAVRDAAGQVDLRKDPERATDSLELSRTLSSPIRATRALAHIRYATCGRLSRDNCHPFVGRDGSGVEWAFVHNGSVFRDGLIKRFGAQAQGQSDSERVLLYLLDALRAAGDDLTLERRVSVLADALAALSVGNKLNVILDDGTYTYVHTNTEDDTLFTLEADGASLFCTRPLDEAGWRPVPKRRVLAYRDGRLVTATEAQGSLYHLDEKELNAFLLANAA